MNWTNPFAVSSTTYFVPWVKMPAAEGERAEGPMIRKGVGRQEMLIWTVREAAELAARELLIQTGGSFEIRLWRKPDVVKACREYSSWGSKVVAVILK